VLLAQLEADRAPELHELRLREQRVQALPERVVGEARVPGDRVRPLERGALAALEARESSVSGSSAR
jgi:hypothetical protein